MKKKSSLYTLFSLLLLAPSLLISSEIIEEVGSNKAEEEQEIIAGQCCGRGRGDREKPTLYDWNKEDISQNWRYYKQSCYKCKQRGCLQKPRVCYPRRGLWANGYENVN